MRPAPGIPAALGSTLTCAITATRVGTVGSPPWTKRAGCSPSPALRALGTPDRDIRMSRSRWLMARRRNMKRFVVAMAAFVTMPLGIALVIPAPVEGQTAPSSIAVGEIPGDLLPVY